MKKLMCAAAALATVAAVAAQTMSETSDRKWEISVPAGEEYTLTADDVSSIGSRDLVKGGEGTLVAGAVMKDFAQTVYITNGVYRLAEQGGLGSLSTVTHTYVCGHGTLENHVAETSGWDATSSCGKEWIHIEGTGYNGAGAISNCAYSTCFSQGLTLTGDAKISSAKSLHIRQFDFDMGGHDLQVSAPGCQFNIVSLSLTDPGNLDVDGFLKLDGVAKSTFAGKAINIREGGRITVNGMADVKAALTMGTGSAFWGTQWSASVTNAGPTGAASAWSGPVELKGRTLAEMVWEPKSGKTHGLKLSGYVYGDGGITNATTVSSGGGDSGVKVGGWLQLSCPTNAFKGGVAMVSDPTIAGPVGGLSVLANGAVPQDGGPVVIGNSSLWLANDGFASVALPDVTVVGSGVVTGQVASALAGDGWTMAADAATMKSLTKTGDGVLEMKTSAKVLGATEIRGGTLRLGTSLDPNAGLEVYYVTNYCGYATKSLSEIFANVIYRGVCPEGVAAAYHAWPRPGVSSAVGTYQPSQQQTYYYQGYIRIPGEEGATTNVNFVSCMCRQVRVDIAGQTVVKMNDTKNEITGEKVGNGRLGVNPAVALPCGWQKITVVCANDYDSNCGPWSASGKWVSNFGIGVDWQARCTSNSTDYVKLVDPGDGSFLRCTTNAADGAALAQKLRPSFGGAVSFAAGTTLDLGDADGAAPLAIPNLEGLPIVTNGVLTVADATWKIDAADIAAGGVLKIAGGAKVEFPERVTIDIDSVATLRKAWGTKVGAILSAATADAYPSATKFVLTDAAMAAHWQLERVDNELRLVYNAGLIVIVR